MEPISPRVEQIVSTLKGSGHRITPQRLAILREFADSPGHPSVETVYAAVKPSFPTTSLATVYKTITLLKEVGEVLEIGFAEGGNRYDVRMPEPHPHLVCLNCRSIFDVDLGPLPHITERVALETGFRIMGYRVDFYGLCQECREAATG
jgi:Fur family transcriptional regulator, peroxide stress response regulator